MSVFKVAVCRFGHAVVMAESEAEAKEMVSKFEAEHIHWMGKEEEMPPFLVTYAEVQRDADNLECRQETDASGEESGMNEEDTTI